VPRVAHDRSLSVSKACVFLLAAVMVAVAVLGSYRSGPTEWAPAETQLAEAAGRDSAPADKVQAQIEANMGFAIFPPAIAPPEREPTIFQFFFLESDGCRPGHRGRIERPPRAQV